MTIFLAILVWVAAGWAMVPLLTRPTIKMWRYMLGLILTWAGFCLFLLGVSNG